MKQQLTEQKRKDLYIFTPSVNMGKMISKDYLAGFVDGEGTIGIYKHKDKRVKKGYTLHPRFEIINTNEEVLKEIQKLIGGKMRIKLKRDGYKIVKSIIFQDYQQIKKILESILPFLIIKQEQAKLMIEFCQSRIENKGKKYSERDYEMPEIFLKINKRGKRMSEGMGIRNEEVI